jgi:TRAP-type C4-dicarboxylate transport system substrate-binding protein
VYSRADLWRTAILDVALFLTATSANAVVREFRAADARSEDDPAVQALRHMGRLIAEKSGGRSRIRVLDSRQPGEETGLGADGAENNWPSLVTTDQYNYAGYDTLAEPTMSPEFPVMSQRASQSLSMEKRKIFGDPAIRRRAG